MAGSGQRPRRRLQRQPISVRLAVDDGKENVGNISKELFAKLFAHSLDISKSSDEIRYVAIAPWQPPTTALLEDATWTILPVKARQSLTPTSAALKFSISSLPHTLKEVFQIGSDDSKIKAGLQVLVLDVQPAQIDTIFVKVDSEALRRHEEVQQRFGGGFHTSYANGYGGKGKGKMPPLPQSPAHENGGLDANQEDILKAAVRQSLAAPIIVRQGDSLRLPLPAHPITHTPFPPISISACEPVSQGLIFNGTQIVIVINPRVPQKGQEAVIQRRKKNHRHLTVEEDEDTSTEQFFSAVENDASPINTQRHSILGQQSGSSSSESTDDSHSDESEDNMISLAIPSLPLQQSGALFAVAAASPRARNNASTPGSVSSNFTATTARYNRQAYRREFLVKPLGVKITDSILHPIPPEDEDDEARVFVDVKMLVSLHCFSADWVRMTATPDRRTGMTGVWPAVKFGEENSDLEKSRVVKVYGITDAESNPRSANLKGRISRRQSQASAGSTSRPLANAYISPILFENLGQPSNVVLSLLLQTSTKDNKFVKSKVHNYSKPPVAKAVTLHRLPTPLSTERTIQGGLLVSLKQYFEHRRRILEEGDLIAIKLNVGVSRALSVSSDSDHHTEKLFVTAHGESRQSRIDIGVAWFKVGRTQTLPPDNDTSDVDEKLWGGAASIEPLTTRMIQVGSEPGKLPGTIYNPWEFYLDIKQFPRLGETQINNAYSPKVLPGPKVSPLRRRARELLAAAMSPHAIHLRADPLVLLLHSTQRKIGKTFLALEACADLGLHLFPIDAYDILTEGGAGGADVKTEAHLRAKIERALSCGPEYTVLLIRHIEVLNADRIAYMLKDILPSLRALIMSTTDLKKIPDPIRSLVTHEMEISAPDEGERELILKQVVSTKGLRLTHDIDLAAIAVKTAALVAGDLVDVVERAMVARQERLDALSVLCSEENRAVLIRDLLVSGGAAVRSITKGDFDNAVDAARKNFADSIGAPKIPSVSWDDVGGLTNVKDTVMETIQLPLERPELFAKGMKKRSGILFYGPPGTGKTLLAKAIATEFSLNFFSVKGPELLNMYIGESEANVRRVFQRARDAKPCVVFFDELDSVAPKRGNQGDSGGVMDRIVSQLLAELDGMSEGDGGSGGVFVIGATNRPDLLDQALLRPGRFDKMLYLGVSDTHDKQTTILEALTRKFTLDPKLSLRRIADALSFTYTGADLYALCSDAMLKAINRRVSAVDAKIRARPGPPITTAYFFDHLATPDDLAVIVTEQDFFAAQHELVGSVR